MLNLFINSALIENMVFAYFFGMCSYIAVSKSVKTALGLGAAVTFVQVMTVPLNYLLNEYVLTPGALGEGIDLSFLSFILFIAVIAAFVQLVEMIVEKFSPSLYNQLGIFLPLIAVNCAIMGGSLFMQQMVGTEINNVGDSIVYGLGSGTLFGMTIIPENWYIANGGFYSNTGLMLFPPMALIIVGCIIWIHRTINKDLQEK